MRSFLQLATASRSSLAYRNREAALRAPCLTTFFWISFAVLRMGHPYVKYSAHTLPV